MLIVVLLALGLLCFLLAAFNIAPTPKVSLLALGLAFVTAASLVPLLR